MAIINIVVENPSRKSHGHQQINIDDTLPVSELINRFCKAQGIKFEPKFGLVTGANVTLANNKPLKDFKVKDGDLLMLVNVALRASASRLGKASTSSSSAVAPSLATAQKSRSGALLPGTRTSAAARSRNTAHGIHHEVHTQFVKFLIISGILMAVGGFFLTISLILYFANIRDHHSAEIPKTNVTEATEGSADISHSNVAAFVLILIVAIGFMLASVGVLIFAFYNRRKTIRAHLVTFTTR